MIEIAFVEIRERHEAVKIVYGHLAMSKGDHAVLAQFPQHPVDVNRTPPHSISQHHVLRQWAGIPVPGP